MAQCGYPIGSLCILTLATGLMSALSPVLKPERFEPAETLGSVTFDLSSAAQSDGAIDVQLEDSSFGYRFSPAAQKGDASIELQEAVYVVRRRGLAGEILAACPHHVDALCTECGEFRAPLKSDGSVTCPHCAAGVHVEAVDLSR
ncbi:MAG: hypothetical protein KDA61_06740 [Planctomycetales bacterium]|nr:hypothetical protein [Planctomycetales bacterium]